MFKVCICCEKNMPPLPWYKYIVAPLLDVWHFYLWWAFFGSVGFLHPRSCHLSGRYFTRAHLLWIQVRYITRLEGVGGQGAFRYWLYGCPSIAGVLKAIVSSQCLSHYRNLFNLRHLVHWWYSATHTLFLSYSEITMTLKDTANQLLLPILKDIDPSNIQLFTKDVVMETELRKGLAVGIQSFPIRLGISWKLPLPLTVPPSLCFGSISLSLVLIHVMMWSPFPFNYLLRFLPEWVCHWLLHFWVTRTFN